MTTPGLRLTADERHHLAGAVEALAHRFEGTFSRETVERIVDDCLARFEDARITTHLPVLVERFAKLQLETLRDQAEPATA